MTSSGHKITLVSKQTKIANENYIHYQKCNIETKKMVDPELESFSVSLFWQIDIKVNIWITLAYTFVSNVNIFNLFDILSVEWTFLPDRMNIFARQNEHFCHGRLISILWLFHAINCLGSLRITWLLIEINLDSFWANKCQNNYRGSFWSKKILRWISEEK